MDIKFKLMKWKKLNFQESVYLKQQFLNRNNFNLVLNTNRKLKQNLNRF